MNTTYEIYNVAVQNKIREMYDAQVCYTDYEDLEEAYSSIRCKLFGLEASIEQSYEEGHLNDEQFNSLMNMINQVYKVTSLDLESFVEYRM